MKKPRRPPAGSPEAQSLAIDAMLAEDKKLARGVSKLVVLGIPGSGKATLMRHLKLIYGSYTNEEREQLTALIHANIVGAARKLCASIPEEGFSTAEQQECRRIILEPHATVTETLACAIRTLLNDPSCATADLRGMPSFDLLERITTAGYSPTNEDILQCKTPAPPMDHLLVKGPMQATFSLACPRQGSASVRKWLSLFADIPVVLLLVNMDDYADPERIRAATALATHVCGSRDLHSSHLHLILNHSAALPRRLAAAPLHDVYPPGAGATPTSDLARVAACLAARFLAAHSGLPWNYEVQVHIADLRAPGTVLPWLMEAVAQSYMRPPITCV